MKTSVELSKVILSHAHIYLVIFLFCHFYFLLCWTHTHTHTFHNSPSPLFFFFCRWHTPSNPCSHWHSTRGAHTRSRKLCIHSACNTILTTAVLSHISDELIVYVSRSSMDRGNTRSVWRVQLVPLRFCWSIRTRLVPLLLFCPSRLQMTSFRTSQHQRLPPNHPQLPPRCTLILAFTMKYNSTILFTERNYSVCSLDMAALESVHKT